MSEKDEERKEFHKKYLKTKEFGIVREMVFSRDNNRCVVCGRSENLVCHHKSYKHLGEHNRAEIEDCITLCQICHVAHHKQPANLYWYSIKHPRNRTDLIEKNEFLLNEDKTEVYDAETYQKIPIKKLKRNNYKPTITKNNEDYFL